MLKRLVAGLAIVAVLVAAGAPAANAQSCLSEAQRRAAITNHQAQPLARFLGAIAAVVGTTGTPTAGQLCDDGGRLVWVVFILVGSGQKTVTVDALSGQVVR